MPGILKRVLHQVTKMYIFYGKNQSSTTLPPATAKQKFRQNTKKPLKPKASSRKGLWTQESKTESYASSWRQANENKWSC
jgi:hypothetical protein